MDNQHRPTIRKFNPGLFQPDDEVIAQFVVRKVEFETVLEIVGDNLDSPSCQHVLVVAPRGRGKTMLLARLAAECRTNEKYSRRIVPVRFMEECYEIFTLADFWLEALNGLAKEVAASDADTSLELRKAHAEFKSRWREQGIADRARAAVMGTAERLDCHLVLMVENLQSLVDAVDDDFGWGLRHALQTEPRLTLVATATSRFRALCDAEHAFFELFRPVHLDPLDSKSCHRLWHKLGGGERSETEIEPVRILTGGSPRLIAIIASFASHFSLDRLLDELVGLIDSHTEYFRGHLEGMPKTERRVYLALADLWRPSTTGENRRARLARNPNGFHHAWAAGRPRRRSGQGRWRKAGIFRCGGVSTACTTSFAAIKAQPKWCTTSSGSCAWSLPSASRNRCLKRLASSRQCITPCCAASSSQSAPNRASPI